MYLNDLVLPYTPSWMLCSQGTGLLVIPRIAKSTIGGRAFFLSCSSPRRRGCCWWMAFALHSRVLGCTYGNKLPADIRDANTITLFKARLTLKTYLFSLSYSWGAGASAWHKIQSLWWTLVCCWLALKKCPNAQVSWGPPLGRELQPRARSWAPPLLPLSSFLGLN